MGYSENDLREICAAVLRDKLSELTAGLQGPPGRPGRGYRGKPGKAGPRGQLVILEFRVTLVVEDSQDCLVFLAHRVLVDLKVIAVMQEIKVFLAWEWRVLWDQEELQVL